MSLLSTTNKAKKLAQGFFISLQLQLETNAENLQPVELLNFFEKLYYHTISNIFKKERGINSQLFANCVKKYLSIYSLQCLS